jgi:hypothetical protein
MGSDEDTVSFKPLPWPSENVDDEPPVTKYCGSDRATNDRVFLEAPGGARLTAVIAALDRCPYRKFNPTGV